MDAVWVHDLVPSLNHTLGGPRAPAPEGQPVLLMKVPTLPQVRGPSGLTWLKRFPGSTQIS